MLPNDKQPQLIEAAQCGQVVAVEGGVAHIDVHQTRVVQEPSSSEDLDPYPATDAPTAITPPPQLIYEEPHPVGIDR